MYLAYKLEDKKHLTPKNILMVCKYVCNYVLPYTQEVF